MTTPDLPIFAQMLNAGLVLHTFDLTAAQIATAGTAPVEIIPAQGVGTVNVPVSCVLQYKAGTVGFNNDSTCAILVGAKPVMSSGTAPDGTIVFSVTVDQVCYFGPLADNEPQSNHENAAVFFQAEAGDPGGTGNGRVRLILLYYVMALLL